MRRSIAAVISIAVIVAAAGVAPAGTTTRATRLEALRARHGVLPIALQGELYGDAYTLAPPPPGLTPEQRIAWVTEQRLALGRTPAAWLEWARTTFRLDAARAGTPARARDLATEVLRVYAQLGVAPDARAIARASATLPTDLAGAFADLVGSVADVAAVQAPIAAAVGARMLAGFDPADPFLSSSARDLMMSGQASIIAALERFKARGLPLLEQLQTDGDPVFSDPEGLIVLGSNEDDTYTREGLLPDPVLLVDPAGDDTYLNSAGGACPLTIPDIGLGTWMECNGLLVSVVADLGDGTTATSNDTYLYDGGPAAVQGAGGPGGLGLLVDAGGNDTYRATMTRGNFSEFQPLVYYFDGGAQGFGYAGAGALLDAQGDDLYRFEVNSTHGRSIWLLGQGFGGAGGIGVVSDTLGSDRWETEGLGLRGFGFEGIYSNGTGFYGGVGIQTETGLGDDVYYSTVTAQTVDYYAFGFGAFGGVGILADDGGNDDYHSFQEGTNPWIDPLLNCAYGTGSFGGVGVHLDTGGNDRYYGASVSPYVATVMDNGFGGPGVAYGVFADIGGDDTYIMEAFGSDTMIIGRGLWEPALDGDLLGAPFGHNTWGAFADIGGTDTYVGGPGANDDQWPFGVDRGA
ncbi:MAG TPA: hypothetical protein VGB52_14110 [Actinomycetota bacterium]